MYKIEKARKGFFVAVDEKHKTEEICSSLDNISSVRISSAPIWYVTEFSVDDIVSIIEKRSV